MARAISAQAAQEMIRRHQTLAGRLRNIAGSPEQFRQDILQAARELAAAGLGDILKEVPVESVNVQKEGIRTALLRENGYCTMADLWAADVAQLAAIRGIGEESARMIHRRAHAYARQAQATVKLRLSADDRSPAASRLVYFLSVYRAVRGDIDLARKLLSVDGVGVDAALNDLLPATRGLGWAFTSRAKKDRAQAAYFFLSSLLVGSYGMQGEQVLRHVDAAINQTPDQVWADFSRDPAGLIGLLEEIAPGMLGNSDLLYGLPEDLAHQVREEPLHLEGLKCTLRRYQEWGVRYILHQGRVLLGDEMGLGKTVQAIAAMVSLRNDGATHFLVVCPASLLRNWCKEVARHSDLPVMEIYGSDRQEEQARWVARGGVAVTTYETAAHLVLEEDFRFALLTVDEAHYIKNPGARRTQEVTRLTRHAQRLLFMTGTALENRAEEMVALLRLLQPQVAREAEALAFMAAAPQFRAAVAPVYYRRKREEVLTELPELIESQEWCRMGPAEEAVYEEAVLARNFAATRRVSWNAPEPSASSKACRLLELVEEAAADGRKVIVFSFFLETLGLVSRLLGDRCLGPLTGAVPPAGRQAILEDFEAAPPGAVLAAQVQTGGTGLNIQAASVVVLCEPQLKPSAEHQAISRAYRMGQARNVLVFRLLCEDTIDERILELLAQKQAVFDAFADDSQAAREHQAVELDEAGLGELIRQEIQRIVAKREAALPSGAPSVEL